MENRHELMWNIFKRDLDSEYENAIDYFNKSNDKSWKGVYTTFHMAQAMMMTLENLPLEELKSME